MKSGFGDRLRQLRMNTGITQKQLSEPLKKSESAVRMWELGKNEPDIASLIMISNIFDCTLDYLLCKDLSGGGEDFYRTNVAVYSINDFSESSEPSGYIPLPAKYVNDGYEYIVLTCKGNDMLPRFEKGDKLLVRKQDTCFHGQIAFVKIGDNVPCVRTVLFQGDGIILQPYNSAFESQFFSFEQIEKTPVVILGVSVEMFREL